MHTLADKIQVWSRWGVLFVTKSPYCLCTAMFVAFYLSGCSATLVEWQRDSEMQTPSEIVRTLCGTDASPHLLADTAQVIPLRPLLTPDLYGKLLRRAQWIARVKRNKPTGMNDRLVLGDIEQENPFAFGLALSPKATLTESISGDKASVAVTDDWYGQDAVIGVRRLKFYFQRFRVNWRLFDEMIVCEETDPKGRNILQKHLSEYLDSDEHQLQKIKNH